MTPAERTKRWREKNPERAKEIQERYTQNHPGKRQEISRNFYHRNAESEKKRSVEWRIKNLDKARAHNRKSWHKNREVNLQRKKVWNQNNKDKILEKEHRRRALVNNCTTYKITKKDLRRIKRGPCMACGSTESIQMDHIIPLSRGGSHGIGNLQPLCKPCNISKNARFMTEWRKSVGKKEWNLNAN